MDTLTVLVLAAVAFYLGWCFVFPFTTCWWCKGKTRATDGHGHYRFRRECRVCGGAPFRRLGARLIGRGKR